MQSVKRLDSLSVVVVLFENFSIFLSLFTGFICRFVRNITHHNCGPCGRSCPDEDISFRFWLIALSFLWLLIFFFVFVLSLFAFLVPLDRMHFLSFFLYHFSALLCSCCFRCYCYITQLLVTERIFELLLFGVTSFWFSSSR